MYGLLRRADDVLRRRIGKTDLESAGGPFPALVGIVVVFGTLYGATMGTFGGLTDERLLQLLYSAVKVPLLLFATFSISLPLFYVLNMLLGLGRDFSVAVRALVATQAGISIVLASLAPFTAIFYVSSDNYRAAVLFNALMFAIASFVGQGLLRGYYQPLIQRTARHRWVVWSWIGLYAFVGIQMGWVLRPFVGDPNQAVAFVRDNVWDRNAYEVVTELICDWWQHAT